MKRRSYFSWECEEWSGSKHSESFLIYKTVIMYINFKYVQNFVSHIMDERRVRVFQERVLSRLLGSKMVEVTGGWIKLPHELPNLYIPRDIVGVIKGCDG